LTALIGWFLSAIFKYTPRIATWFNQLNGLGKRLLVIFLSLIVSLAVFGLKCGGLDLPVLEPCTQAGFVSYANIALTVIINSQAAYLILPPLRLNDLPFNENIS
jgi:hypothetical protein